MNEALIRIVFLAHLASTFFMMGVIWFVQVVHYPLFASVGRAEFRDYEARHTALTTWIVAPPMLVELVTAVLLLWYRPAELPFWQPTVGLALVVVLWLSTALVQVPCHDRLAIGYDPAVQRRLVATNWLRTACWSLRGMLVCWMTFALLD